MEDLLLQIVLLANLKYFGTGIKYYAVLNYMQLVLELVQYLV